jgi:hypothetical protein
MGKQNGAEECSVRVQRPRIREKPPEGTAGKKVGQHQLAERELRGGPTSLGMGCGGIKDYSRPRSGRASEIYDVSPIPWLGGAEADYQNKSNNLSSTLALSNLAARTADFTRNSG